MGIIYVHICQPAFSGDGKADGAADESCPLRSTRRGAERALLRLPGDQPACYSQLWASPPCSLSRLQVSSSGPCIFMPRMQCPPQKGWHPGHLLIIVPSSLSRPPNRRSLRRKAAMSPPTMGSAEWKRTVTTLMRVSCSRD